MKTTIIAMTACLFGAFALISANTDTAAEGPAVADCSKCKKKKKKEDEPTLLAEGCSKGKCKKKKKEDEPALLAEGCSKGKCKKKKKEDEPALLA